jgi:hypothetical protein
MDKVALEQVFSEYFDFLCQYSFHQLLHNHPHLSSGVCIIGLKWPQYKGLSPIPLAIKKGTQNYIDSCFEKDYRSEIGIFMEGLRKSKKKFNSG